MSRTVTIRVDSDTAQAFAAASADDRRKLELLLRLRLRDLTALTPKSLVTVMDEIGANAKARGMTSEVLDSLGFS